MSWSKLQSSRGCGLLTDHTDWLRIAEVNPPTLPDLSHRLLGETWQHVVVTDNVFGTIRVSPYAYAARITHDVPAVHPTVVVSTRDRNILAIESEVRGALGNGVDSFLVVNGDTMPHVDHLANHNEIIHHLRLLQLEDRIPTFEVGAPTRFQKWQYRQRIERGAQFLVVGPVMDPESVEVNVAALGMRAGDPPVFLMVSPPFSLRWVDRLESLGSVPVSSALRAKIELADPDGKRELAWAAVGEIEVKARAAGCAGVILTGLKYETVVNEAAERALGLERKETLT